MWNEMLGVGFAGAMRCEIPPADDDWNGSFDIKDGGSSTSFTHAYAFFPMRIALTNTSSTAATVVTLVYYTPSGYKFTDTIAVGTESVEYTTHAVYKLVSISWTATGGSDDKLKLGFTSVFHYFLPIHGNMVREVKGAYTDIDFAGHSSSIVWETLSSVDFVYDTTSQCLQLDLSENPKVRHLLILYGPDVS